jgi:hypothetical protein
MLPDHLTAQQVAILGNDPNKSIGVFRMIAH